MTDHDKLLTEIRLVETVMKLSAQKETLNDAQTVAHAMIFQHTSEFFDFAAINEYCLYLMELDDIADETVKENSKKQIAQFKADIEEGVAKAMLAAKT